MIMNVIECALINTETGELLKLNKEFNHRKQSALDERRPGQPILFSMLADLTAAELGRRYLEDESKTEILREAMKV